MTHYDIEFTGKLQEWGNIQLEADDIEQAEQFARENITETYPEYIEVEIEAIKEINR